MSKQNSHQVSVYVPYIRGQNVLRDLKKKASKIEKTVAHINVFVEGCSLLCLESVKFHETSANHRNKVQIRNVQVVHNFITILVTILHFCPGNPNCFQASIPSGLLAWLTTVIKNEYGSLVTRLTRFCFGGRF